MIRTHNLFVVNTCQVLPVCYVEVCITLKYCTNINVPTSIGEIKISAGSLEIWKNRKRSTMNLTEVEPIVRNLNHGQQ